MQKVLFKYEVEWKYVRKEVLIRVRTRYHEYPETPIVCSRSKTVNRRTSSIIQVNPYGAAFGGRAGLSGTLTSSNSSCATARMVKA